MNNTYTYRGLDALYYSLVQQLLNEPEHVSKTKDGHKIHEIINPRLVLLKPLSCLALCRNLKMEYLFAELEWYYSGSPYLKDIEHASRFWRGISDDGTTVNSNYGQLLFYDRNHTNHTQYEYVLDCLSRNRDSKKAVFSVYGKEHSKHSKDNPCTVAIQVLIRDGQLHMFTDMRSNDIYFGLPYDIPFFVSLQWALCQDLEVEMGTYTHGAKSLHAYERNFEDLKKVLDTAPKTPDQQANIFTEMLDQLSYYTTGEWKHGGY